MPWPFLASGASHPAPAGGGSDRIVEPRPRGGRTAWWLLVGPWDVVVVVCPCRVLRPEAEGGAYDTVGQRAGTRNTVQALPRLEEGPSACPVTS